MLLPVLCILTSKSRRLFMTSSPPPPFFIQRTKARARKLAQELQKEAETLQVCHCQLTALQSYGNNLRNGWQKKAQFFDCPCLPRTIFFQVFFADRLREVLFGGSISISNLSNHHSVSSTRCWFQKHIS